MSVIDAHDFPVDLVLRVLGIGSPAYYGTAAFDVVNLDFTAIARRVRAGLLCPG